MKPRDSFATRPASPTWFAVSARLALISLLVLLVVLGVHGHFATPIWAHPLQAPRRRGGCRPGGNGSSTGPGPGGPWPRRPPRPAGGADIAQGPAVPIGQRGVGPGRHQRGTGPGYPPARTAPVCPGPKCFIVYPKPGPPPGPAGSFHFPVSVLYGLAAGALLAATVVLALSVMRRGRRPPPPELSVVAEEYGEALEAALEGGRRALLGLDGARAAIIACYVAMEDNLAQAGTTRSSAETPDELLARAASTLLVSAGAARRLTALFYEARFSSHPLDEGRRAEAESALSDLAAELSRAQAVAAGAGA